MAEIIKSWLRSRLGVIIDTNPEIFGRYCRDGTFLAKLLHSYDIINDSQLQTITHTSDPALARINLRHLRCWLKFIGIDCNNICIEDISNGKGTASLRLFYKVFLCLENKDRLHFITLQKEREKYIPNSTKFDVNVVSEELPIGDLPDHPLALSLAKDNESLMNWYKEKFQKIIDDCKFEREKFCTVRISNEPLTDATLNKFNAVQAKKTLKENEMAELDKFADEHRVKCHIDCQSVMNMNEASVICQENTNRFGNGEAAKQFIKILKNRNSSMNSTQKFKVHMQETLLSHVWDKMACDQEREFDRIIAKKILDQSQYEKQMVMKLCDIRRQKNRIAANRKLVDELMMKSRENEMRMIEDITRTDKMRENEEIDDEYRRMNELHQRIKLAKQRRINNKLYNLNMKIVCDIIDISINAAELKRVNNNYIPKRIWNEWKSLFYMNLPIIKLTNYFDYQEENRDKEGGREEFIDIELTKINILIQSDLDDYLNVKYPWDEFMPQLDDEQQEYLHFGLIVLGYIVHKLLHIVYPLPCKPLKRPLPDVNIRTVIVGIPDSSFYYSLRELLKYKKIHVFTVEDAINYCLYYYKEQMKDFNYIDLDIVNESNYNLSELLLKDVKRQSRDIKSEKQKLSKISNKNIVSISKISDCNTDRETQTPKMIPYDDTHPQLNDTAYIGKWAYEILSHGEAIPDDLIAKIIVEYLKNLMNVYGWVLFNYPKTHEQMAHLEFQFTGYDIPTQNNEWNELNSMKDIQEINSTRSRISFVQENIDSFISCRESKLLPNPLNRNKVIYPATYLTTFIKMLPKPKNIANINEDELFELRPEDTTSVDHFYTNEGVASAVYYTTNNSLLLTRVIRLIIGDVSLPRISSIELSKVASVNCENIRRKNNERIKSISKVQMKPSSGSILNKWTPRSEIKIDQVELELQLTKPGKSDWIWADFNLAPNIIENLVISWENMENIYTEGLKEILGIKRVKFVSIIPYKDFITRHITKFIARPDNKQEIIRQFQIAFNDIPIDMRDDYDVKCELYCRVDDFEVELLDICDLRRREAEKERKRIINDHWTVMKIMILTNVYVGFIQLEIDRFIDTVQFIQNYYLSMLKRSIDKRTFIKFNLHKFSTDTDNSNYKDDNDVALSKDNNKSFIDKPPLIDVHESNLKYEIDNILLCVDKTITIDITQTSCYKIIQANINYVQSVIDNISITAIEIMQKQTDNSISRSSSDRRGGRRSSKRRLSEKSNRSEYKMTENQKFKNLTEEWRYAFMYEINRIRMKLLILENAKNSDIKFLLTTIQCAFCSIHEMINEQYKNEVKLVNDIAKIFYLAIENEISIDDKIILNNDNISICYHPLISSDKIQYESTRDIEEKSDKLRFTISQLGRLKDIFQRVAPSGFISQLSFIYILQDLIICADKLPNISLLPTLWYELKPDDIIELVHQLFTNNSYIDWREFIIYAMEIQMPNQYELLDIKQSLGNNDDDLTGIIDREEFIQTEFWFSSLTQSSVLKSLLHDNYEMDKYEMFNVECNNESKRSMSDSSIKFKESKKNVSFSIDDAESCNSYHHTELMQHDDELIRMTLIKELLCEMYVDSYSTVNYIAMLLAFCKDNDPIHGLGKALSIALGKRLCLEFDEGENYVKRLLEEKQLSADEKVQQNYQRQYTNELCREFIMELIDNAIGFSDRINLQFNNYSWINIDENLRVSENILIEKFNEHDEIMDPPTHLIAHNSSCTNSYHDNFIEQSNPSLLLQSDELITQPKEREIIYWLSINVCESVLSALMPFDTIKDDIYDKSSSLNEYLKHIYRDIECKELNNTKDSIGLAHRVVNHPFIRQLLQSTSKFTSKNLTFIVNSILNNKSSIR